MIEKGEKVMNTATFEELLGSEHTDDFIESARPFTKLMMQYKCAMLEIQTKFEVLNTELSLDGDRNPIQSVCCRLKQPVSIIEKLKRKGQVVCVEKKMCIRDRLVAAWQTLIVSPGWICVFAVPVIPCILFIVERKKWDKAEEDENLRKQGLFRL